MTYLALAKSFKMMNQPGPTITSFDGSFLRKLLSGDFPQKSMKDYYTEPKVEELHSES